MRHNFSYREPYVISVCSCCNGAILRNIFHERAIAFTGHRSKQGTIFICDDCVKEMVALIKESKERK